MNRVVNPGAPIARQLPLGISLRPGASFDAYFNGGNGLAVAVLQRMAEGAGERQAWVAGAAGLGKSHLLQAACHAAARHGRRPAYLPLAGETGLQAGMLEGLEALDLVCLDGIEAIAGDEDWELALFNLINAARAAGARLLLASRRTPAHLEVRLPDLASRLAWGVVLQLVPPTDAQTRDALCARARSLGLELPPAAADYLQRHYGRDLAGQLQRLETLDRASLAAGRRLTVPFIKQVLSE